MGARSLQHALNTSILLCFFGILQLSYAYLTITFITMLGGTSNSNKSLKFGEHLKSNQSITYSQTQVPENPDNPTPFGAQIYLPKSNEPNLLQKYMLLCMEVQRLTKLASKQQSIATTLSQEVQIRINDSESFRQREDILQRELSRIREEDRQLVNAHNTLQQALLKKNSEIGSLQEEIAMITAKISTAHPKHNFDEKIKIRELETLLENEASRMLDLERQLKEAVVSVERTEQRMNSKAENDRKLLINSENRIQDLEEQLRTYVAQKALLEQNELRFSQQQMKLEQTKTIEFSQHVHELQALNKQLVNQKHRMAEQISSLEKETAEVLSQLRIKDSGEAISQKTQIKLQQKLESITLALVDKDRIISELTSSQSDLQYRLQTTSQQMKRVQSLYDQSLQQACKSCQRLQGETNSLSMKVRELEQVMIQKESEHRVVLQRSQNDIRNLRELLQSVNNLKGSNQRVSRLIEMGTQKLIKSESIRNFVSSIALS